MVVKKLTILAALVMTVCTGCGNSPTPDYPTNLNGTNGTSQEYLGWSGVTGSTGYNLYRGTFSGNLSSKTLIVSNTTDLRLMDATVTRGTHYYYQVTSINPGGESQPSHEIEVVP